MNAVLKNASLKNLVHRFLGTLLLLALGAGLALSFSLFAGENPLNVAMILVRSATASRYDLGMTLAYSTPLIFTGLAVSFAYKAGLFNVGAEGQLLMGALGVAACGIFLPEVPWPLAPLLATAAAMLFGGIWGSIPGLLLVRRGSHEVITTIMMNFVAAGLVSWFVLDGAPSTDTQNPETMLVAPPYRLGTFSLNGKEVFEGAPLGWSTVLAVICACGLALFFRRAVVGYELRIVGANPSAAAWAGIQTGRTKVTAMACSGALAGLVALPEVLGNTHRLRLGFSPDYGFIGIAVALLARARPLVVIVTGLLFGALQKGAGDLDFQTTSITRDFSLVIQAVIILMLSAQALPQRIFDLPRPIFKKMGATAP
jgi:simple sugar transport system permease protein